MNSDNKHIFARPVQSRLLIPLVALLLILIGGATIGLIFWQQNNLNQATLTTRTIVSNSLSYRLAGQIRFLESLGIALSHDTALHGALKDQDREWLLAHYTPILKQLRKTSFITHFYFHDPDRVNLLRVHKPDFYGDTIDRFTALEAERTGTTASGIELGPLGLFTLRSVVPIFAGDTLIGYLEIGKEIEDILTNIEEKYSVELAVTIHKTALNREKWQSGMKMLGRKADWNKFPSVALTYFTMSEFPPECEYFINEVEQEHFNVTEEVTFDNRTWRILANLLQDVSGAEVGYLIIFHDISVGKAAFYRFIGTGLCLVFAFLFGLFGFLLVILRQTDRGIIKHQKALVESEKQIKTFFNSVNDAIFVHPLQQKGFASFIEVNTIACTRYGYSREELLQLSPSDITKKVDTDKHSSPDHRQKLLEVGHLVFETVHISKSGEEFPVEISASIVDQGADKPMILAVVRDISERKQIDDERRRLMAAIEQAAETIVITDSKGTIQYVNPAFEKVTGYTRQEAMGANPRILKSGEHDADFYKDMWKTLTGGKTWNKQIINRRKDGTRYVEEASISPVRDESGKTMNYVAVKHDVTHEIQLEEQYRQAQKMDSVGRLAGGVAHDFNNMLGVILGNAQLALMRVNSSEPLHKDLQEIEKAAKRSADITRQLLAFARKQTIAPRILDLNEAVANMLKMLQRLIGENIALAWIPEVTMCSVKIDPGQIDQLLANLCVNARDAITDVGKISIETKNITLDTAYCADHAGFIPGEYVQLAVSDNGCGMAPEIQGNIFDPFFTTKELGKGTGLGLATVYGIVKQNNGFINVYSEPGQGTVFRIYLLRHLGKDVEKQEKRCSEVKGGHETVLLVEDEAAILKMTKKMLESMGYHVLPVATPKEAIAFAASNTGQIDLLLTDVVMPEMNGMDLTKQLLEMYPDLKNLFMSGYTANVIAHHGILNEGVHFIQKPFSRQDLAASVRKTLDEAKNSGKE